MKRLFVPPCLLLLLLLLLAGPAARAQTGFSGENAERILRHLSVEIGPRPMGSPAEQQALAYACASFRASGCDTAYVLRMKQSSRANTTSGIAVGIRRGATGRIMLIGGHIDSAGPEIPGADDDGSGSAVVMELARVISQRPTQSTMVYCCFGGEEEGLQGSRYFAEQFPGMDSIALMLQVDMANGLGTIDLDPDTHGKSAPRWLVRAAAEEFSALGYSGLRYPTHFFSINYAMQGGSGSDHESFLAKGIPAIDFSTDISKPIHTPRDNFENFEPAGLKRSGDLVLNLARRFDAGVPDRTTEKYWLMLLPGNTPLFVPLWGLWLFAGIAGLTALAALLRLRRARLPRSHPGYAGWSVPKLWPAVVLIVSAGWLSPDLLGLLTGLRHPWMTAMLLYTIFGSLAAIVAALLLSRRYWFRLTRDPYPLLRSAVIMLVVMTGVAALISTKLIAEPAAGLLLVAAALLLRRPAGLKALLLAASPVWVFRLFFTEWAGMLFRMLAYKIPASTWLVLVVNGLGIFLLSLLLFPFLLAAAALLRESDGAARAARALRGRRMIAVPAGAFLLLGALLLTIPAYNRLWYRDVCIDEQFDMEQRVRTISVRSSEYLKGMRITRPGGDTVITGRTAALELSPREFDTTWVEVTRKESREEVDAIGRIGAEITLRCARRPYQVVVRYVAGRGQMGAIGTPWMNVASRGEQRLEWRYFPDSLLVIPVRCEVADGDSVTERIEVTFDRLADPLEIKQEMAYVLARTTYVSTKIYR